MFRGINCINLDAKGRVAIPTRYRAQLAEDAEAQIVVTIDTESPCLLLYPLPEWEIIERKLEALPSFNTAARRIQRLLIGHAHECELDGHGRVVLPQLLRDYAGLQKQVMLVGQGKKFELWSDINWENGRSHWLEQEIADIKELPPELLEISL